MKSLELNWIRKKDKSLVMPEVMFKRIDYAGGLYYPPDEGEIFDDDGKPYSLRYGIIVVNPDYDMQSTIAHEWRHHWQHFNGMPYDGITIDVFETLDYSTALKRYFMESKSEMDALRFEHKHATICECWEVELHDLLI